MMEEHLKILVPYDFSDAAKTALEYVRDFVKEMPFAEIILGYIQPDTTTRLPEELMQDVVSAFGHSRSNPVSWELRKGDLIEGFSEIIARRGVDLLLMGTNSLHEGQLATNASQLALQVQCPVFVIPKDSARFRLQHIGLLIGSEPIHNKVLLGKLLNLARAFNARVSVLTVRDTDDAYGYGPQDEANDSAFAYYLEESYSHHAFIEGDDLGKAIFTYTESNEIDLIAILPKNHAQNIQRSEGRLTKHLCEHSKTPLLVIDL
ncbi:universal stress protein [Robertkochia sediminum]|uniref:universal stress protein n=1 Tax=Robertkochia sediminum TaxID=2785326 RepID=UPI0019324A83|nr:universal stress protein [Robertkochia sediminum]MBL7472290.1 universal stress protein [Robertkochia sediminum]